MNSDKEENLVEYKTPFKSNMSGKKMYRGNIQGLKNPEFLRLAHKAGVKRMNGLCYDELRGITKIHMEGIIRDAMTYKDNRRAKTVSLDDMLNAIENAEGTHFAYSKGLTTVKKCS